MPSIVTTSSIRKSWSSSSAHIPNFRGTNDSNDLAKCGITVVSHSSNDFYFVISMNCIVKRAAVVIL